jgi:NAD(P)-dependent dehydrogenase (short-subunit alcohol dehydrogenase family)
MDLGLGGRTAIITGASKGIGRACARRLALEGVHVHLVARTAGDLENVASEIRQTANVRVTVLAADLGTSAGLKALADAASDADILVNNAGAIPAGNIDAIDEDTWRHAWDLKVFGYINLMRIWNARMRERGRGVIVNIIGAGGERPSAGYAAGAGGNAALMALTRALGGASTRYGVRIVGINPGAIATDRMVTMLKVRAKEKFGDESRWQEMLDPVFPPGTPEQIADATAFLASDLSANTTGTILTIDGGHCSR